MESHSKLEGSFFNPRYEFGWILWPNHQTIELPKSNRPIIYKAKGYFFPEDLLRIQDPFKINSEWICTCTFVKFSNVRKRLYLKTKLLRGFFSTGKIYSDWNGIRTHNHLVRKRTVNHWAKLSVLAKWLNVRLGTKWFCGFKSTCTLLTFWYRAYSEQGVSLYQATTERRFTLKRLCDMIKTHSQENL